MGKIFLTDVDAILLKWSHQFGVYMDKRHGINIWDKISDRDQIYGLEDEIGITEDEMMKYIKAFHKDEELFSNIPAYDDALEIVNKISQKGWGFVAITSCGLDKDVIEMRKKNLEKYFPGVFIDFHAVEIDTSKFSVLSQYSPTNWVDDSPEHVITGRDCGHTSFRIVRRSDTRINDDDRGIIFVENWWQIYRYLF